MVAALVTVIILFAVLVVLVTFVTAGIAIYKRIRKTFIEVEKMHKENHDG